MNLWEQGNKGIHFRGGNEQMPIFEGAVLGEQGTYTTVFIFLTFLGLENQGKGNLIWRASKGKESKHTETISLTDVWSLLVSLVGWFVRSIFKVFSSLHLNIFP